MRNLVVSNCLYTNWSPTPWETIRNKRLLVEFSENPNYYRENIWINEKRANGIASLTPNLQHMPMFDFDVKADDFNWEYVVAKLAPIVDEPFPGWHFVASRSGNVHGYLNTEMYWPKYAQLLEYCIAFELCDKNWAALALVRGYSVLRIPKLASYGIETATE